MNFKFSNWNHKNCVVIYLAVILGIIFAFQIACKKELPKEIPSIVTVNITNITSSSFISGGLVYSAGGDSVLSKGICLSTGENPITSDIKTVDGSGTGSFTSRISGLANGTTYYIRAYATNRVGTGYGNQYCIITALETLSLTTASVSSITSTTSVSGGTITSDDPSEVTGRGVCWSTTSGPTTADNTTFDGTGLGSFTSTLTGLTPGFTYYVKAYAINSSGTFYGNEVTFKTECNLPVVPGAITGNTNLAINAIGVAYSISAVSGATGYTWEVPEGATITDGQGTTSIIVNFGTTGGVVRVRSDNSCGSSTYSILNITLTHCGTVTDIEGNVYNTVKIGTQCWTLENMKTTKYNNGDPILYVTDDFGWSAITSGAYCWYNNNAGYKTTYGALYNWYTVNDSRNLCPTGWHVPTDSEWTILTDYLGGIIAASAKLKESGTIHWNDPNGASTNESGFTAIPAGYRRWTDGRFYSIGDNGTWWSSTSDNMTSAWSRALTNYDTPDVQVVSNNKGYGISVRCLKN